uniref:Uncharacterized protein n=1 Tax=Anguilla anguilla TaxID=7936 RepID=A0A0E9V3R2_ANGAN
MRFGSALDYEGGSFRVSFNTTIHSPDPGVCYVSASSNAGLVRAAVDEGVG